MDNQPKKPVAVVIGAGPGLGASLIRRFAKTYSVAILARKADYLKALAGELRQSGATVQDLTCDVRDPRQITDAFRAIRQELGDSEVLLYNAGSGTFGGITEITPDQYEADWRVNAFGAFVAAKEVAPAMIARGHGTTLFTGATAGVKAGPKSVFIWTREVRDAWSGAITCSRPWSERYPRGVDQRRWQHRYPGSAWPKA